MDIVGEARMQVLFWNVYDAKLYAPGGAYSAASPFALSLTYLRDLQGDQISERSIEEMRKQGFADEITLARWFDKLSLIIPDVGDQNEIIGLADEYAHTRFYLDGTFIGEIKEPGFTRAFFDIWLGERTSEPALRDRLLGGES
ncbi:MAG: chalcone isomerase family protein [Pseudomonadota bacterium]